MERQFCIESLISIPKISLNAWRHINSKLRVWHFDFDSPLTRLLFVVPTEIQNDTGCPHTLEHLCFMGSKKYPYRGVLDRIANKMYAQGTNAWTDVDKTVYTLQTVGSDGALNVLPVYLDHLLNPLLKDSAFTTEIYHINGRGEDAGVVFSEMQAREHTTMDLVNLKLRQMLFPQNIGYSHETGGRMKELRLLTIDQIREYHAQYYKPENMSIVVIGPADSLNNEIMQYLDSNLTDCKSGVVANSGKSNEKQPWIDSESVPPLSESKIEIINFPEQDEGLGEVAISWLGPQLAADTLTEATALEILFAYLTETPISPLQANLIESEPHLCSSVSFSIESYTTLMLTLSFGGVDQIHQHLEGPYMGSKLLLSFWSTIGTITPDSLDMTRINTLIDDHLSECREGYETHPHDMIEHAASTLLTYTPTSQSMEQTSQWISHYFDVSRQCEHLKKWTSTEWHALLKKYIVDAHSVTVIARPSRQMVRDIELENAAIISLNQEKYGTDGLNALQKSADDAKRINEEMEAPDNVLTEFEKPSLANLKLPDVSTVKVSPNVTYNQCASQSVQTVMFESSVFFEERNSVIPAAEIVAMLERDLLSYDIGHLPRKYNEELICFEISASASPTAREGLNRCATWMSRLFFNLRADAERIKVAVEKSRSGLIEMKRIGHYYCEEASVSRIYDSEKSTRYATGMFKQLQFLEQLQARLDAEPDTVVNELQSLMKSLFRREAMRVHVIGGEDSKPLVDIDKVLQAVSLPEKEGSGKDNNALIQLVRPFETLSSPLYGNAVVFTHETDDSVYCLFRSPNNSTLESSSRPAILLSVAYFNLMEGELWKEIRGGGLAYGYYLSLDEASQHIEFRISNSSDAFLAWKRCREFFMTFSNLNHEFFESAKCSLIERLVCSQNTPIRAAAYDFITREIKGLAQNYDKWIVPKIQQLTPEECFFAVKDLILPLFEPKNTSCYFVVPSSKVDATFEGLSKAGFITSIVPYLDCGDEFNIDCNEIEDTESSCSEDD